MAVYNKQKQQQEEALKENLYTIEYCLNYKKTLSADWNNPDGCLGYPAFILICSIIDTIGSFFRGTETEIVVNSEKRKIKTASDHFLILNHDKLFNMKLKQNTIDDFYSTYRSKLVHNSSLPKNNFLNNDKTDMRVFLKNSEDKIELINLYPLFEETKKATKQFLHWLKYANFSDAHRMKIELQDKEKINFPENIDFSTASGVMMTSGYTETILLNSADETDETKNKS